MEKLNYIYEHTNLNVTRKFASYNKSYLAISFHTEKCRLLISLYIFPWQSINIASADFDNFSYVNKNKFWQMVRVYDTIYITAASQLSWRKHSQF